MRLRTALCAVLVGVYVYYGWLAAVVGAIASLVLWVFVTRLRSSYSDAVEVDLDAEPLLGHSATRLAAMIRDGQVTSLQLVEVFIKQIEKVNPQLNAVVATRFEEARKEARIADEITQRTADKSTLPPLHGVPCSVKESIGVEGMPQSAGLAARRHHKASDATVVRRLRNAGAIPLGVTNTSEVCMWMESTNKLYGQSNNPYNINHTVGGSSGGEGAIVAACGAPFGVGSDIGGSIRMPCFFNGIFGHKPSAGLVPNTGQFPIAANQALRYHCTGPMCKRAEDLWPLLQIMVGPDGQDVYQQHFEHICDPEHVDVSSIRVLWGDPSYPLTFTTTKDMKQAQKECVEYLRSLGAKDVQKIDMSEFKEGMDIWSAMLSQAGGPTFSELLGNGKPIRSSIELLKWAVDVGSSYTLPAIGLALLETLPRLFPARVKRSVEKGSILRKRVEELLGDDGVLILPTYPSVAPAHGLAILPPTNWVNTAMWNVMEVPATAVPLGLNSQGLPLGVQVIGKHGNDHLTIAVAMMLERRFGGWVAPRLRRSSSRS